MVPTPIPSQHSSRLFILLYHLASRYVSKLIHPDANSSYNEEYTYGLNGRPSSRIWKRDEEHHPHDTKFIVFACLIPVLVILSGVLAGLTLGYMSLDETQLNVLSISGTPQQREYANKIKPIRKNGHLLLVTLLLGNMIVNETLPIISDPVLGGGVQSVVVSTVLIVIFAEIIPQSLCTRHGLYLGAKMARPTQMLIYLLGIVSWPVAKLLEFILGPHHGIIYRRAELKELIALHSSMQQHGGDLKSDTVTIIGATLDLQEKVVQQAMTPIQDVFMLSIDSKLDYETMKKICLTGHSRVPVYEEVDIPIPGKGGEKGKRREKKIIGILLVKQCVLLDPKDAVPVRKIPLNKVPFVPKNMSLLGILDKFQEGRSHMAIVSRVSVEKAQSVVMRKVAKRSLTQRLKDRVGMGDSSDSSSDEDSDSEKKEKKRKKRNSKEKVKEKDSEKDTVKSEDGTATELELEPDMDGEATTLKEDKNGVIYEKDFAAANQDDYDNGSHEKKGMSFSSRGRKRIRGPGRDVEMGVVPEGEEKEGKKSRRPSFVQSTLATGGKEQMMPADAVLDKEGAEDFLQGIDPAVMPLGIITLEDVLEELIGEEIYDEFDPEGGLASYVPVDEHKEAHHAAAQPLHKKNSAPQLSASVSGGGTQESGGTKSLTTTPVLRPIALKGLSFITNRSRSAPPTPRDQKPNASSASAVPTPPRTMSPPTESNVLNNASPLTPPLEDGAEGRQANVPTITLEPIVDSPPPLAPVEGYEVAGNEVANQAQAQGQTKSKSLPGNTGPNNLPASAVPGSVAASRSASPAPSLEAILLDRKRRLAAAGAQGIPASGSGPQIIPPPLEQRASNPPSRSGTTVKGSRFKSSPLGGGERSGVVIAEKVKEELRKQGLNPEEVRIPDDQDKVGPDKHDVTGEGY